MRRFDFFTPPPHLRIDYVPINNRISGQGTTVNIRLKMQEGELGGSSARQEDFRVWPNYLGVGPRGELGKERENIY